MAIVYFVALWARVAMTGVVCVYVVDKDGNEGAGGAATQCWDDVCGRGVGVRSACVDNLGYGMLGLGELFKMYQ